MTTRMSAPLLNKLRVPISIATIILTLQLMMMSFCFALLSYWYIAKIFFSAWVISVIIELLLDFYYCMCFAISEFLTSFCD